MADAFFFWCHQLACIAAGVCIKDVFERTVTCFDDDTVHVQVGHPACHRVVFIIVSTGTRRIDEIVGVVALWRVVSVFVIVEAESTVAIVFNEIIGIIFRDGRIVCGAAGSAGYVSAVFIRLDWLNIGKYINCECRT